MHGVGKPDGFARIVTNFSDKMFVERDVYILNFHSNKTLKAIQASLAGAQINEALNRITIQSNIFSGPVNAKV
jgi:hypothetical protein